MQIEEKESLEIIKMEMGLIQNTLDKYDDLIFRNRNWFITLWMGTMGATFTFNEKLLPVFSILLAIFYWFIEGMMRHQYWYKYVLRYRTLRDKFNTPGTKISDVSLYDLTNHYMEDHGTSSDRLNRSFFKLEPSIVYGVMAMGSLLIWLLIQKGVIELACKT